MVRTAVQVAASIRGSLKKRFPRAKISVRALTKGTDNTVAIGFQRRQFPDKKRGRVVLSTGEEQIRDAIMLRDLRWDNGIDQFIDIAGVGPKAKKNQKKNDEPYPSSYKVRQAKKLVTIKKVTEEGQFISVRLRDPGQFKIIRTPAWAIKVAESVTKGSKVRMGQTPKGNWLIQTILIPKQRGKVKARSMGRKIQKKIEGK